MVIAVRTSDLARSDMTPEGRNSGAREEAIATQRLSKQVSAATDTQAAVEELL
jgi:hypothetical protein